MSMHNSKLAEVESQKRQKWKRVRIRRIQICIHNSFWMWRFRKMKFYIWIWKNISLVYGRSTKWFVLNWHKYLHDGMDGQSTTSHCCSWHAFCKVNSMHFYIIWCFSVFLWQLNLVILCIPFIILIWWFSVFRWRFSDFFLWRSSLMIFKYVLMPSSLYHLWSCHCDKIY